MYSGHKSLVRYRIYKYFLSFIKSCILLVFLAQRRIALAHPSLVLELEIYVWFYNFIFHLTATYHKTSFHDNSGVFAALTFKVS